MHIKAIKTSLQEILYLRELFLQQNNFQVRYNAVHARGWSDSYLLYVGDQKVGYGSAKGKDNSKDRDTIFELYIIPSFRAYISAIFRELITASKVTYIECQSNDLPLSAMLYEFSQNNAGIDILRKFI